MMTTNLVARNQRSFDPIQLDPFNAMLSNRVKAPVVTAPRSNVPAVRSAPDPFAEFNPQAGQSPFANNVTVADLMRTPIQPTVRPPQGGQFWDNVRQEVVNNIVRGAVPTPTAPTGGMGGGGGAGGGGADRSAALGRATSALEAELAALESMYGGQRSQINDIYGGQLAQLGSLFGGYRSALGQAAGASRGQIDAATAQALSRLAELDPQAAFQWAVQEVGTPGVAGGDYLSAIGASQADVDAARMLSDQLLRQQLSAAQQYAAGSEASMGRERQARQAASTLMSQEALNALAQTEQQYGAQIAAEEANRRAAIEAAQMAALQQLAASQADRERQLRDQLLRYQLEYDLGI